jgi:hypothetical protein
MSTLLANIWNINKRDYTLFIAAFVLSLSLKMIVERFPKPNNDSEKSCEIPEKLTIFVNNQQPNIHKITLHA